MVSTQVWGGGWICAPDYDPTGDELWSCTGTGASVQYAGSDSGGYCDPQTQADILATETSSDIHATYTYEDYLAKQLPNIWLTVAYAQLSEINKDLKGAGRRLVSGGVVSNAGGRGQFRHRPKRPIGLHINTWLRRCAPAVTGATAVDPCGGQPHALGRHMIVEQALRNVQQPPVADPKFARCFEECLEIAW
jgi:hypothetical protein